LEALPLLPKAVIETASYAGLREGELRGLEWPDYTGDALNRKKGEPTETSKAFDPAVLAAMKTLEATLDTLKMQSAAIVQQAN
jgi:hypothetical protein